MKFSVKDLVELVFYSCWLLGAGAFLAFGWRLPGTLRSSSARTWAWAGTCVSLACITFVVVGEAGTSAATARLWDWRAGPICLLIGVSLVLFWKAARAGRTGDQTGAQSTDDLSGGKHARH
jgi:uncharacterized membrane protein